MFGGRSPTKRVSFGKQQDPFQEDGEERHPLVETVTATAATQAPSPAYMEDDEDETEEGVQYFSVLKDESSKSHRRESMAADRLSMRLLQVDDDDEAAELKILQETLDLDDEDFEPPTSPAALTQEERESLRRSTRRATSRFWSMTLLCFIAFAIIIAALWIGSEFIGPPSQPVGPYELIERQEGDDFFGYYSFYEGPDSVGSNGYIDYVSQARAFDIDIANVTYEADELDVFFNDGITNALTNDEKKPPTKDKKEPFLYIKTAATEKGPRESIRLEGKRRFNRGLFIIDVRHMPSGCGTWPAFWLTDEANWPVNGEIDIVEGVNFQSEAKTALHTTKGCDMLDVPLGTMTGSWDTAVGIPDKKTGIPDMTFREAKNCFVYDPHQWLNQGCVAIDTDGGSLGEPLNKKGGGIFALEWDPVNRHIRTWVFSPHSTVPENLVKSIRSASEPNVDDRVMPDPQEWPLPYGYFPIGQGTNCDGTKFKNMRLVLNTALCGSVAGNRFFLDCKNESKTFKTCNEYIKSNPDALREAYWKIRGVYVYERKWQRSWYN